MNLERVSFTFWFVAFFKSYDRIFYDTVINKTTLVIKKYINNDAYYHIAHFLVMQITCKTNT